MNSGFFIERRFTIQMSKGNNEKPYKWGDLSFFIPTKEIWKGLEQMIVSQSVSAHGLN